MNRSDRRSAAVTQQERLKMTTLTTAIQEALAELEKGDTLCEINAAHILRQALESNPVVLPESVRDDAYTRRVIEALQENGDPVSVDAAEEMERLRTLLATCGQAEAVPVAVTTDEELAKLGGENVGSKMAAVFHPSASGFQVKLYAAPRAQADARDADVQRDAERYRWLFNARTKSQTESFSGTVCSPLLQDEVISEIRSFYMHKAQVDELIDAARNAQGVQRHEPK